MKKSRDFLKKDNRSCYTDFKGKGVIHVSEEELNEIVKLVEERMTKPIVIPLEVCRENVQLPTYAHTGDACMDIRSAIDIEIRPQETVIIPTGLKVTLPRGYELQVRPRSGISAKTMLRIANGPGTIDSGYRDEIGIILYNSSISGKEVFDLNTKDNQQGIYKIKKGDRVAQILVSKVQPVTWKQEETTQEKQDHLNRGGGFGHSGIK